MSDKKENKLFQGCAIVVAIILVIIIAGPCIFLVSKTGGESRLETEKEQYERKQLERINEDFERMKGR